MKLSFVLRDESFRQALRFYPLKDSSSIRVLAASKVPDTLANSLQILMDFAMAEEMWGETACLSVSASFGLLYLPHPDAVKLPCLACFLEGQTLYLMNSESVAADILSDYRFERVERLSRFYSLALSHKILVTSQKELADAIISSAPQSFYHLILNDEGFALCLGAEYWDNDSSAQRSAFHMAEELGQRIHDRTSIPFLTAQSCHREASSPYGFFADRYDSYMEHVDYDLWYARLTQWYRIYRGGKLQNVLELACGTANVASRFVHNGCTVDACDLSAQMLENADLKPLKPNLYQASLTDPIPRRDYDMVLCLFDSINYLLSLSQISVCLDEVEKALAVGGLFIFDISTMLNSMENFCELCNYRQEPGFHMVHEAFFEPGSKRQVSRLRLFKEQGAAYTLFREEHQQKVYMVQELVDLVAKSKLSLKAIHSTESKTNFFPKKLSGLDHRFYRLFFILTKDESTISE